MVSSINDIIVYSKNQAKHIHHLRRILSKPREYEFYAKASKCSIGKTKINFVGRWMSDQGT